MRYAGHLDQGGSSGDAKTRSNSKSTGKGEPEAFLGDWMCYRGERDDAGMPGKQELPFS